MQNLETIEISIEKLLPLPRNAKIHTPEQIENIKNSITTFGFNDPLGVWQNEKQKKENQYYVVTGSGTLEACKIIGFSKIPCNDLSNLTEEEIRAYAIAHNATQLKTGFDNAILEAETAGLDFDFSSFGLDVIPVYDGNIDEFFIDKDGNETKKKVIICPHCGKDINEI